MLFDIILEVGEGEIVTLLGRNGMGKTTTIRSIMGLMPPARGSVDSLADAIAAHAGIDCARAASASCRKGVRSFRR